MVKKAGADWKEKKQTKILSCLPVHIRTCTPSFCQPQLQFRAGTASPVSRGGNKSVSAQDALLRQSLEQSLCPNEEDPTDSTCAPTMGSGFCIHKCSPTKGTNDFAPCQGKRKIGLVLFLCMYPVRTGRERLKQAAGRRSCHCDATCQLLTAHSTWDYFRSPVLSVDSTQK